MSVWPSVPCDSHQLAVQYSVASPPLYQTKWLCADVAATTTPIATCSTHSAATIAPAGRVAMRRLMRRTAVSSPGTDAAYSVTRSDPKRRTHGGVDGRGQRIGGDPRGH